METRWFGTRHGSKHGGPRPDGPGIAQIVQAGMVAVAVVAAALLIAHPASPGHQAPLHKAPSGAVGAASAHLP